MLFCLIFSSNYCTTTANIILTNIFFFSFGKMLSKSPKLVVSWKRPNNSGIHTGYLSSCEQSMVQIRVTDSKSADIDIDFSKNE